MSARHAVVLLATLLVGCLPVAYKQTAKLPNCLEVMRYQYQEMGYQYQEMGYTSSVFLEQRFADPGPLCLDGNGVNLPPHWE